MNTERPDNDDAAAESGAEEAGAPGTGGARENGDGSGKGRSARRTPVIVASVAAAVLVAGGGGAFLAASTSGGSDDKAAGAPGGDGTPPPLPLDGYSDSGGNGIAPGEPNPYGTLYRADGTLPDGPGSAPVYRASGQVTKEEVARLAEALDVDGTPVIEGEAWKLGAKDGAGPSLQVNRQAPGTWTFYRYAPGTDNCTGKHMCTSGPAAGDPVSVEAAKKAAAPVLKAVGQDDAKLTAGQVMGANRVVNADPLVGGLPTYGWSTGVTVGASGEVVGASGQLTAPVKSDTYPVLDAKKTLALLNAAQGGGPVGIGGCASAVPLEGQSPSPCEPGTDLTSPEPKKQTITVRKAVFGLAAHFVAGRQALVPSWLFEVRAPGAKDSFTVTHPAVDPKYLTSPTPSAEPTERPSPRPTGPGGKERTAKPRDVAVEGYTAEGTELTVSFTGGVCADYEATASESAGKVTVKVTETPWPDKVCIMIAKVHHRTVRLDAPLGDRAVVGSDGKAVPLEKPGARLPQAR